MPHRALKVIRPMIRLSSALAPRATGRAAFRLFCMPLRPARVDGRNPALARLAALHAQAETFHVTHGCGHVRVARFAPQGTARGSVLMLHGWAAQGLFLAGFAEKLVARGYEVLVMDFPGHGGSSGRQLTYPLALEAIAVLARRQPRAFSAVVGHSFGGAVAMAAVAGGVPLFPKLGAERLVAIAAPAAMQPYGRQFTQALGLDARAHEAFEGRVQEIAGRPMESFSGIRYLREIHVPTLLIHAPDDKEAPFSGAERMAQAGPHVRLEAVPGLGHRRILFDEGVQARVAAFIEGV